MAPKGVLATVFVFCFLADIQAVQDKNLIVTSLLVRPFLIANAYTSNGITNVTYDGYIPDLLDELVKLTNITYTLSVRSDSKYGHQLANGSWDGLIGDVVEGKADIAAGPLTETSSRSRSVEFSTPFMNFGPVIILKRPKAPVMCLTERLQRLFAPLSQSIWMMSGLAWLVTSAVLYIICYIDPYDWRRLAKDKEATFREGESFSCLNTFWFTMSNFLWQGYTQSPKSLGGRIVATFWWLYVLIFIVMYVASMTNYLRVGPVQSITESYTGIQSIEDLGQQSGMKVGVIQEGATEQYLKSAKIPKIKKVWTTIHQEKSYVQTLEEAIDKVRTSQKKPFAFIAESAMGKYFTKQSPCDIYMVGDFITIGSYSLAFQVNSPLVKRVDIAILTLRERGVLKVLEDRWFSGECTEFVVESNSNRMQLPPFYGVDLGTFSGALIILGIGLIIGSFAAGIESFIFKCAEQAEKKEKSESESGRALTISPKDNVDLPNMEQEPITDV